MQTRTDRGDLLALWWLAIAFVAAYFAFQSNDALGTGLILAGLVPLAILNR